jgi:hypothetical protein
MNARTAPSIHRKIWRGEFKNSTPEKPVIDIARWERALNGKAIRVLHSINDGTYGGESILRWDAEKKELIYFYFTTAGFYTTGAMTIHDGKITSTEKVTGSAEGTTDVRTTYELRADGSMLNKAEYLKNGVVTGSREVLTKNHPTPGWFSNSRLRGFGRFSSFVISAICRADSS